MTRLPDKKSREQVVAYMVEHSLLDLLPAGASVDLLDSDGNVIPVGPFEEDRFLVHDFLDRHDSSIQTKARRATDAARKRAGRRSESSGSPVGRGSDTGGSPVTRGRGSRRPLPDPALPDQNPPQPPASGGSQGTGDALGGKGLAAVPANSRAHGTNPRAAAAAQLAALAERTRAAAAAALTPADDDQAAAWERVRCQLQSAVPDSTWGLYLEPLWIAGQADGTIVVDGPAELWAWVTSDRNGRLISRCADAEGVKVRLASQEEHDGLRAVAA